MPDASAPHPRKRIRAAIVEAIRGPDGGPAPTEAGRRVYDSRDLPMNADKMPVVLVYTTRDRILTDERHVDGPRHREMTVAVEVYDTGDDAAEVVDRVSWAIENLLRANPDLGNTVELVDPDDTDIVVVQNGELALFVAAMGVTVHYWTHAEDAPPLPGYPPASPLLGFSPDVGEGHEPDYHPVVS